MPEHRLRSSARRLAALAGLGLCLLASAALLWPALPYAPAVPLGGWSSGARDVRVEAVVSRDSTCPPGMPGIGCGGRRGDPVYFILWEITTTRTAAGYSVEGRPLVKVKLSP
jgi:hypothetical protein